MRPYWCRNCGKSLGAHVILSEVSSYTMYEVVRQLEAGRTVPTLKCPTTPGYFVKDSLEIPAW